jgi:uncharacterized repeat protein (TIGR03803 family)
LGLASVVFRIETDGNGFEVMHEFSDSPADGCYPWGDLTLSGSTLYGMSTWTPNWNGGTVFSIETDGSDFTVRHAFCGDDGDAPYGGLILSGDTFFGMTSAGGAHGGGVIFRLDPALFVDGFESGDVGSWTSMP